MTDRATAGALIFCEKVLFEVDGLFSLIRVFDSLVVPSVPLARILCIYMELPHGIDYEVPMVRVIEDPSGKIIHEEKTKMPPLAADPGHTSRIAISGAVVFERFGKHHVYVTSNGMIIGGAMLDIVKC